MTEQVEWEDGSTTKVKKRKVRVHKRRKKKDKAPTRLESEETGMVEWEEDEPEPKRRKKESTLFRRKIVIVGDTDGYESPIRKFPWAEYDESYIKLIGTAVKRHKMDIDKNSKLPIEISPRSEKTLGNLPIEFKYKKWDTRLFVWDFTDTVVEEIAEISRKAFPFEEKLFEEFVEMIRDLMNELGVSEKDELRIVESHERIPYNASQFYKKFEGFFNEFITQTGRLPDSVEDILKVARGNYYFVEDKIPDTNEEGEKIDVYLTPTSTIKLDYATIKSILGPENFKKYQEKLKEYLQKYHEHFKLKFKTRFVDWTRLLKLYLKGSNGIIVTGQLDDEGSIRAMGFWAGFCSKHLKDAIIRGKIPFMFVVEAKDVEKPLEHRNMKRVHEFMERYGVKIRIIKDKNGAKEVLDDMAVVQYLYSNMLDGPEKYALPYKKFEKMDINM